MADYKINADGGVTYLNRVVIPNDPKNRSWIIYQEWVALGGEADPYLAGSEGETSVQKFIRNVKQASTLALLKTAIRVYFYPSIPTA